MKTYDYTLPTSEFAVQIWREHIEQTVHDLRAGLARLNREPDPQGSADLAQLLSTLEPA